MSVNIIAHRKSLLLLKEIQGKLLSLTDMYNEELVEYSDLLFLMEKSAKLARLSLHSFNKKCFDELHQEMNNIENFLSEHN